MRLGLHIEYERYSIWTGLDLDHKIPKTKRPTHVNLARQAHMLSRRRVPSQVEQLCFSFIIIIIYLFISLFIWMMNNYFVSHELIQSSGTVICNEHRLFST